MRILSKEEAKRKMDIEFIYRGGNALAIVPANFDQKYYIITRNPPSQEGE